MTTTKKTDYIWGDHYNCILPDTLTVQLKSADDKNLELDLIYCSIYMYVDYDTCFALHLIPTDSKGKFTLSKDDLIFFTELQFYYTDQLPLDLSPVKYTIMVTPKDLVKYLTQVTEQKIASKAGRQNESPIDWHAARQIFFEESYDRLWPDIKKNRNLELDYDSDKSSIDGQWSTVGDFHYDLTLQL